MEAGRELKLSANMQTAPTPAGELGHLDLSRIAQDLQIRKIQVESVVQLLDEGNTIPFITRYRKERTGGLDEEVLRLIQDRVGQLRQLAERKQTILKSIDNQGRLTPELRDAVLAADNPKRLEDIYLPYKPKKRSLATAAREKGLEPLALAIWYRDPAVDNLPEILQSVVDPEKGLTTSDDVLLGVQHILAELVSESADVRALNRAVMWDTARLVTAKSEKLPEGQGLDYKDYFQFMEPVRHIPAHRVLAINRGEKENALTVKFEWDVETGRNLSMERLPLPLPGETQPVHPAPAPSETAPTDQAAPSEALAPEVQPEAAPETTAATGSEATPPTTEEGATAPASDTAPIQPSAVSPPPATHEVRAVPPPPAALTRAQQQQLWAARTESLRTHPHAEFIHAVVDDALSRLLIPSLEREIRRELTRRAEDHAVSVFARNLRSKLLAAPLRGKRVLAVDPGFRTGCKLAVLDDMGNLIDHGVIFPHPPQNKKKNSKLQLEELVRRHHIQVIAIGNGTACRETEEVVSELLAELDARRRGEPIPAEAAPEALTAVISEAAPPAATEASVPAPTAEVSAEGATATPVVAETPAVEAPAGDAAAIPAGESLAPVANAEAPPAPPQPPPEPAPTISLEGLPEASPDLAYVIVNEAGASVYSASPVGREEFPDFDATLRGTISIGRRLQDPLSELVKIDPQHVGVGLYQHDVHPKHLRESLDAVIESCVNTVGVDLNTASVPLLRHVSGMNQLVARELVQFRNTNGPFRNREDLLKVPGIGEARFVQAAGFLKIESGENPLDRTWIHPESYGIARQLLGELGYGPETLQDRPREEELREKLKTLSPQDVAQRLQMGEPTIHDILEALARPGRDPREDLPPPVFKKGILKLEDLQPNMELKGTVLNVVDFGAFIDVGLKDSGLVHISQMANRYVKSPYEVAAVGDVVNVWVLSVDKERRRVSLTMIAPGTERKPPERRPQGPPQRREQAEGDRPPPRGDRPQRGDRPPPRGERAPQGARPQGQGGRAQGPPPRGQGGRPQGGRPPVPRGPLNQPQTPRGKTRKPPPAPKPGQQPQQGATAAETSANEAAAQQSARKSRRQPAKPNLTSEALAGAAPLGTFAELAAFWAAKKAEDTPAPAQPEPESVPPTSEAPPEQSPPPAE
jgi:protein Tex